MDLFLILWGINLGVEFLDHMVYLTFEELTFPIFKTALRPSCFAMAKSDGPSTLLT